MEKISNNQDYIINFKIINSKYIKYPFSGVAPKLINKFLVLGYEQKVIDNTFLTEIKEYSDNNECSKYYEFKEKPSIMNEICSDYTRDSLENDTIISLIFPQNQKLFYFVKNDNKDQKEKISKNENIQSSSIIFSLNPQDNNGSRNSFNGLGYVFYIKKEHRNNNNEIEGWLYYPNAYVILSDYPYFYHFNKICENIYIQMKKETDEIPIDIILYNAIKYCPSPINKNIILSFGAQLLNNAKLKIEIDDIMKQLSLNNNENSKGINGIPFIFFNQITGYPLMDLNLSFLFNLLDIETIILTFILTFLEYDVIFVSNFPEILNIVMYIFNNFNYPFNDSIYYWHVVSVSEKTFLRGHSSFVDKVNSSMIGICCKYSQKLNTTKKIREHYLVDIDKKESYFLYTEESESFQQMLDLEQYIRECIPEIEENEFKNKEIKLKKEEKYFKDGINLYESIRNLGLTLIRRIRNVDKNVCNNNKPFFVCFDNKSEIDMIKENLEIQKAFYNFIIQMLDSFYSEFNLYDEYKNVKGKDPNDNEKIYSILIKPKKKEKENDKEKEETLPYKAGLIFKKLFKDCSKYSSYFINFCQYHDCIDMSRIPFSFINEFFYYSKLAINNDLKGINIFEIIDQFYGKEKRIDFIENIKKKQKEIIEEISNDKDVIDTDKLINDTNNSFKKTNNIYNFSYDEFETFYKNNLRAYINREQEDDKNNFIKEHGSSKQYKTFKRNNFYLSQKILEVYINFSNNNFNQLNEIFKLIKYENKNRKQNSINKSENNIIQSSINKNNPENLFGTYELIEISDLMEKHLIKEKYFSCYEMMKFSLLSIIAIAIGIKNKQISNVVIIKNICDFCYLTNSLVRRYMNIYLIVFATMKINKILNEKECNDCTNIIISYFKRSNTFPTEDTVNSILKAKTYIQTSEVGTNYETLKEFKNNNKKIREKRAEFYKRMDQNKESELIDNIERVHLGWYYLKKNKMVLNPNIEFLAKKFTILYSNLVKGQSRNKSEFMPKTPLELYDFSNKLLNKYLSKFYLDNDDYIDLGIIVMNLLYFLKMEFLLKKWTLNLHKKNLEDNKTIDEIEYCKFNDEESNKEIVKILVMDIIYILLDLYEAIINNKNI